MLFITNRMLKQSPRSKRNRKVSFDLNNSNVAQSVYFCERHSGEEYTELGSKAFFTRLKEGDSSRQLLLYIHGFNNQPEPDIFKRANALQTMFDQRSDGAEIEVIPIIWPCDNDVGMTKDYWDDQEAADASIPAFARVFGKFMDWRNAQAQQENPCLRRINVLAHSMGNRVLRGTLSRWTERFSNGEIPLLFRNTFMVAADVVNECLESGKSGAYIPESSRNVVVYYANDDLAMPASKIANVKNLVFSRRLGMTGPEDLSSVPKNVFAVDCDDFNNTCDFPKGHAYFLECPSGKPSPVFEHMLAALTTGRVSPDVRQHRLLID